MPIKSSKYKIEITGSSKGFTSAIYKSQSAIRLFNREMSASQRMAKQIDHGLTGMAAKFSALFGGLSAGIAVKSLWDAGIASEKLDKSFAAITGSAAGAKKELAFVRQEADRLGREYLKAANGYKTIAAAAKGTSLQGTGIHEFYTAIVEAGTALGATDDELSRVFLQASQGISRGRFELEDLKTIAEALPGVGFKDFADALGVTTEEFFKMVSAGQVVANDFLPKLSKALHEKFGKAAVDAADSATGAMNLLKNSFLDLKIAIAKAGFMDMATGKIKNITAALKDPQVQAALVKLATGFFKMAEAVGKFIVNHGEFLLKAGATITVLAALNKIIFTLSGTWRGMNAAMKAITGMRLIPWLAGIREAAMAATAGLSAMELAANSVLVVAAAWGAGQVAKLVAILWDWRNAANELAAAQQRVAAQKAWIDPQIASRLAEINQQLGTQYKTMDDLFAAEKRGEVAYNDLTGTWVKGSQQMAAAATDSANTQKQVTGAALAEMKRKYQEYAGEVQRLQDQIAGRERSLAEQLRAMARTGMSDLGAWQDRKREADEYAAAAEKAARSGNFDEAVKLADQAKTAYADLNKEVKAGDQVLISQQDALQTSMAGVKSAGELAISILKQQKDAAKQAMAALDDKSGGQLSGKIKDQLTETQKALNNFSGDWGKVWQAMGKDAEQKTAHAMTGVEREIKKIVDKRTGRTIYIDVVTREKKQSGGPVGLRTGGKLAGFGGGDRIPALLEAGEFIIRKEAVARFGSGLFSALNNLHMPSMPSLPELPKFATGGPVMAGAGGETVNINLTMPTGTYPVRADRMTADKLLADIKRMQRFKVA